MGNRLTSERLSLSPLLWAATIAVLCASRALAQGAAPETAPTLFPGGGLASVGSLFTTRGLSGGTIRPTARPTFANETVLNFTWGFYRDFDVTVLLPVETTRYHAPGSTVGGAGIGDAMVLLKYRFFRRDSPRGTNQASVTLGPKFPSGRTSLTSNGSALPAGLQPGSGSTDLFLGANWTYTGLFNFRRLVADEDFHSLLRSQGIQRTRLGTDLESRFWISYRPYEAKDGSREWFIGPVVTWLHNQDDRIAGVGQRGSGGDVAMLGVTTYLGVRPGMHVWLGTDWDVAHSTGGSFMPVRRRVSFGITQQFRVRLFK